MSTMATNPYIEGQFYKRPISRDRPVERLSSAKRDIYNPQLPSFRRIDMDNKLGKMPQEHCRSTTTLTKGEFEKPTVKLFEDRQFKRTVYRPGIVEDVPPVPVTPRLNTSRGDPRLAQSLPTADMYQLLRANLSTNPAPDTKHVPAVYSQTFGQEPKIDWKGQMPTPANINHRFRSLPNNFRDVSSAPWK